MPARKPIMHLFLGLLAMGVLAAIVYGFCQLIILRPGINTPDPASGRVAPYQVTYKRSLPATTVYVSPAYIVTVRISGWITVVCLGPLAALCLGLFLVDALRVLIPAHHEWANRELARYRR